MSRLARIRAKVKKDEAMNLTELARVTSYDRGTLRDMLLPLQGGKIFYTDFRRIIKERQDRHEHSLAALDRPAIRLPGVVAVEATRSTSSLADKFRAPKSTHARPAASRARGESRPRNTELQRRHA
jgi:hypothetical protein